MDVSGSMTDKLGAVAHFIEALKEFPLRVRSFDTEVREVDPAAVAAGTLVGGGGTDFDAPVLDLAGDPELAAGVLFTDGEANLSELAAARLRASGKRFYVVYLMHGDGTLVSALDRHATAAITVNVD
jgi:predicted metal-dependent peptidase